MARWHGQVKMMIIKTMQRPSLSLENSIEFQLFIFARVVIHFAICIVKYAYVSIIMSSEHA